MRLTFTIVGIVLVRCRRGGGIGSGEPAQAGKDGCAVG